MQEPASQPYTPSPAPRAHGRVPRGAALAAHPEVTLLPPRPLRRESGGSQEEIPKTWKHLAPDPRSPGAQKSLLRVPCPQDQERGREAAPLSSIDGTSAPGPLAV